MGFRYYEFYIDSSEFPTLADQEAEIERINELHRQKRQARLKEQQASLEKYRLQNIGRPVRMSWSQYYQEKEAKRERKDFEEKWGWIKGKDWVYFIRDPELDIVKIGFSSQLLARLERLKYEYHPQLEFD